MIATEPKPFALRLRNRRQADVVGWLKSRRRTKFDIFANEAGNHHNSADAGAIGDRRDARPIDPDVKAFGA